MSQPDPLLDACVSLAREVSSEATERLIAFIEVGKAQEARSQLSGDALQLYDRMLAHWRYLRGSYDERAVACTLRGARWAIECERRSQRVELVWSGPSTVSSTLRSTAPALVELINSASESVYVVAFAAYKVQSISDALRQALQRGVRIVAVLENAQVSGGKVSFDPLPHLIAGCPTGVEVYVWPQAERVKDVSGRFGSLHAKFAVADRARLLVSSANLTEYAFSLNIELGVLISGGTAPGEAAGHVDKLIGRGVLCRASG